MVVPAHKMQDGGKIAHLSPSSPLPRAITKSTTAATRRICKDRQQCHNHLKIQLPHLQSWHLQQAELSQTGLHARTASHLDQQVIKLLQHQLPERSPWSQPASGQCDHSAQHLQMSRLHLTDICTHAPPHAADLASKDRLRLPLSGLSSLLPYIALACNCSNSSLSHASQTGGLTSKHLNCTLMLK